MKIEWREVELPDFGVPEESSTIPTKIYEERCCKAYTNAGCDWLIIYGDREHFANLTYLTAFDPRFEEALLLLGPDDLRILVVGNEGMGYTSQAGLKLDIALCQTFSLMGQDRSIAPSLLNVLLQTGIRRGQRLGLVGWKYLEPEEWSDGRQSFFAPAMLVDLLRELTNDPEAVVDKTWVLMHPTRGLRSNNEVEQIAAFEWAAARASSAVLRIVRGTQPGMTELQAVSCMGYAGEPLSAHVMFTSGKDKIIGLHSPRSRRVDRGVAASTGVGFWGGLCCRAGLVIEEHDEFLTRIAIPYFRGLASWYNTVHIGVKGHEVYETVSEILARGGLRSALNPGHLTSLDEWVHSPIRLFSTEQVSSGMAFQSDIIPVPMPPGFAINCEDTLVFADSNLRVDLARRYPETWSRIQARQDFMRQKLGIEISDETLPLSTIPAYLSPLWLLPSKVLVVD
jgi:hypothetical protein